MDKENKALMETASGAKLDVLNPSQESIVLSDIVTHLSRVNRFAGATNYSVLRHSLYCCNLSRQYWPSDTGLALAALTHDFAEAYVGDLIRVQKQFCPDYRKMEGRIQVAINERFGLPELNSYATRCLKYIDDVACKVEAYFLLSSGGGDWYSNNIYSALDKGRFYERPFRNGTDFDLADAFHEAWRGLTSVGEPLPQDWFRNIRSDRSRPYRPDYSLTMSPLTGWTALFDGAGIPGDTSLDNRSCGTCPQPPSSGAISVAIDDEGFATVKGPARVNGLPRVELTCSPGSSLGCEFDENGELALQWLTTGCSMSLAGEQQ